MIIGICGKSGSGKSYLSKELENLLSATYINIDEIGHNVLLIDSVKYKLVNAFGNSILENNKINRKKLSNIVFNSKIDMDKLTNITWVYMESIIDELIKNNKIIILDWLLLPKTKYFNMCDIKILLNTPYKIRKKRCKKRDNISDELFDLREKNSIDYHLEDFDFIINDIIINKKEDKNEYKIL